VGLLSAHYLSRFPIDQHRDSEAQICEPGELRPGVTDHHVDHPVWIQMGLG
jgi:hypothetical protein